MQTKINTPPKNWDRRGLPTWTYKSQSLFDIERKKIFRTHWQLVCHQSDIPDRGSYTTFDVGGDRALIIRGHDDIIRAFHNLCRHRGSRVVSAPNGHCKHVITCPFHGWSWNLDGSLKQNINAIANDRHILAHGGRRLHIQPGIHSRDTDNAASPAM